MFEKEELSEIFDTFDIDHKGYFSTYNVFRDIPISCLSDLIQKLGVTLDPDELRECSMFFNKNKDDKIYFPDFVAYVQDFDPNDMHY